MLVDTFGRTINYLRVSITDRCNLRCLYCMPADGAALVSHAEILRHEEIEAVVAAAAAAGIRSVRLTGGEPLVRRGLVPLVKHLNAIPGIEDVSLTTNGVLLKDLAAPLCEAGVKRLNIGLPSLDPDIYRHLTRGGDVNMARAGLAAALAHGFAPIKINVVVMGGINDDLRAVAELTRTLPVEVRFIEYMAIGPLPAAQCRVPAAVMADRVRRIGAVEQVEPWAGHGPSQGHIRLVGAPGQISFIAAASQHQCGGCNRLRLTANGRLRPCLLADMEIDLLPALRPTLAPERLKEYLQEAVAGKPSAQPLDIGKGRCMSQIGG